MTNDIDDLSYFIAIRDDIDDYSLWRMRKEIEYEIHDLFRGDKPVPLELLRLRAIVNRARELRRKLFADNS